MAQGQPKSGFFQEVVVVTVHMESLEFWLRGP